MTFIKKQVVRLGLFVLFAGALITTYTHLTNVSPIQLKEWFLDDKLTEESTGIQPALTQSDGKESLASETEGSSHLPSTLNNAEDWSQYPTKEVVATGYTAGVESTGKTEDHPQYGITFSGVEVKRDLYSTIAADPDVFPLGTVLFIPEYGYGVVADTGSAIKGDRIDLYYETVEDVYNLWGKKSVDVFIIEEGQGTVTEEDLIKLNEAEEVQSYREEFNSGKAS